MLSGSGYTRASARGYQDLPVDMANKPGFAHKLMGRIVEDRESRFRARAAFPGQPTPGGSLFNDEVDVGVIGGRHYRKHILPHEQRPGAFHGAITYWTVEATRRPRHTT